MISYGCFPTGSIAWLIFSNSGFLLLLFTTILFRHAMNEYITTAPVTKTEWATFGDTAIPDDQSQGRNWVNAFECWRSVGVNPENDYQFRQGARVSFFMVWFSADFPPWIINIRIRRVKSELNTSLDFWLSAILYTNILFFTDFGSFYVN